MFGFQTSNKSICCDGASSIITLTLFWNTFKYQCHVNPIKSNTYYSCHTSNITTTSQCINNPFDRIQYGLQIDSHHLNAMQIDRIIVKNVNNATITGIPYDIDYFFYNSSLSTMDNLNQNKWDIIPISNKQISAYKLFEFISKNESNVHVLDTATNCTLCSNAINTPYYGGIGGMRHSVINQGRIAGISSWGITSDGTLSNIQWIFDEFEETKSSNIIEHDQSTLDIICDPFTLDIDDYIIGYNVMYGEFVFGLVLYTLQNKSYGCIDTMYNDSIDESSGIILYKNYYLTGFYSYWQDVTYSIAFQFTPFKDSDLCSYKYIAVESPISWQDGNNFCEQQYNTSLATIITESDFQIANYIKNTIYTDEEINLWIGLVYNVDKSQWVWIDDTSCNYTLSGECVDDQYWALNEADIDEVDNNKHCVVLSADYNGFYKNVACSGKHMFLCNNPHFDVTSNLSTDSTKYPIDTAPESDLVHNDLSDNKKTLQLNGEMMIGISIVLGCCMIPLAFGMMFCCFMYYHEAMVKMNIQKKIKRKMMQTQINDNETKQIEDNKDQIEIKISPKKSDQPQTTDNKVCDKQPKHSQMIENKSDDIENKKLSKLSKGLSLSDQDSLKVEFDQLSDVYTITSSRATGYNSINLDDETSSGKTNSIMNIDSVIDGYLHNGIMLDIINS